MVEFVLMLSKWWCDDCYPNRRQRVRTRNGEYHEPLQPPLTAVLLALPVLAGDLSRAPEVPLRQRPGQFDAGRHLYVDAVLSSTNIDSIDKDSYEITRSADVVTSLGDLADELPDNSSRYVLLCYPLKTPDGRLSSPLVLVYWKPPTCGLANKMLYAGAVELFRDKAGVSKYVCAAVETTNSRLIQIEDEDDLEDIELHLK